MKSVQVKDLSCQPRRKVRKKPRGHREHLAPGTAAQCPACHLAIAVTCLHSRDKCLATPFPMVGLYMLGAGSREAEMGGV